MRQVLGISVGVLTLISGIYAVRLLWLSPPEELTAIPPPTVHMLAGSGGSLSGPFVYKNLTVYLVHGENTLKGKAPIPLENAMKRKLVIVHETEDVNELAIENVSANDEVFVQAGDIVKGGQQDRVLAVDLIVPAKSGRIPIDSFCVEQGRWTARGSESRREFNSSADYAPSKSLKLAAKSEKSQQGVWARVAESQDKLSAATNSNTASDVSRSSLPLTLENEKVRKDSGEYVEALSKIVNGKHDVIGFVFSINGKINSAEVYGSGELFVSLWPKLLKAAAIEAVAESSDDQHNQAISVSEIEEFFTTAEGASVTDKKKVTDRVSIFTREADKAILFESTDRNVMLHRNYVLK